MDIIRETECQKVSMKSKERRWRISTSLAKSRIEGLPRVGQVLERGEDCLRVTMPGCLILVPYYVHVCLGQQGRE